MIGSLPQCLQESVNDLSNALDLKGRAPENQTATQNFSSMSKATMEPGEGQSFWKLWLDTTLDPEPWLHALEHLPLGTLQQGLIQSPAQGLNAAMWSIGSQSVDLPGSLQHRTPGYCSRTHLGDLSYCLLDWPHQTKASYLPQRPGTMWCQADRLSVPWSEQVVVLKCYLLGVGSGTGESSFLWTPLLPWALCQGRLLSSTGWSLWPPSISPWPPGPSLLFGAACDLHGDAMCQGQVVGSRQMWNVWVLWEAS
jgi:hypothetical protein